MKSKVADFIDTVLLFLSLSIFGIIAARYFTKDLPVILISGLTSGLGLTFIIGIFKNRKQLPKQKQKILDETRNQFIFSSREYCSEYIKNALSKKYEVNAYDGLLMVKSTAISVHLCAKPLDMPTFAENFGKARGKAKRIIFLTAFGAEKQVSATAPDLPDLKVDIFDFNKVYELLKWLESLPELKIVLKKSKSGLKLIAAQAFSVDKSKRYLFAALLLLLSSLFMRFAIYYIIIAAMLISFAVLCRIDIVKLIKGKSTKKEKDHN